MITSISNTKIKNLCKLVQRAKVRREQDVFIVEGIKMAKEAPKRLVQDIYVSETFIKKAEHQDFLTQFSYEVLTDELFKKVSDTKTPQGILCVLTCFTYQVADMLKSDDTHLLILENIQDPGNLGTMIRTAEGAGVTGVIMNDDTVDIYNPKVVRATMGSIYRVPFVYAKDFTDTLQGLKKQGISLYAAHLEAFKEYSDVCYQKAMGFLIGNEGSGLTEETAAMAEAYINIPMSGCVESLNASVAASILMYEVKRQRRVKL